MISIIIPVYNNYKTLAKCLNSVIKQSFSDYEIIVVDDGSTHGDIIKNIIKSYPIKQFIRQSNQGAPNARNKGFKVAKGKYLLFLDADIVLNFKCLKQMKNKIIKEKADVCYTGFKMGWKKFKTQAFSINTLQKHNFIHTTSLIRNEVFTGFDENLNKFQDWDLWLTLAKNNCKFTFINQILFKIIDSHGTMSSWLPKGSYKLPWPIFGFTPLAIKKYNDAKKIIKLKHKL